MAKRITEHYRRTADIVRRDVDSTTFLVNRRRNTIHQLNSVGATVWDMLVNSARREELAASLKRAFPDVDHSVIERDLDALIGRLLAEELIAAC